MAVFPYRSSLGLHRNSCSVLPGRQSTFFSPDEIPALRTSCAVRGASETLHEPGHNKMRYSRPRTKAPDWPLRGLFKYIGYPHQPAIQELATKFYGRRFRVVHDGCGFPRISKMHSTERSGIAIADVSDRPCRGRMLPGRRPVAGLVAHVVLGARVQVIHAHLLAWRHRRRADELPLGFIPEGHAAEPHGTGPGVWLSPRMAASNSSNGAVLST